MKKKLFFFKILKIYLTVVLVFGLIAWGLIIWIISHKNPIPTFTELASQIVLQCQDVKYRPTCYDNALTKLMDPPYQLSMEDSFKISSLITQQDSEYGFCHVLGHKLASKETAKDPSKWKKVKSLS